MPCLPQWRDVLRAGASYGETQASAPRGQHSGLCCKTTPQKGLISGSSGCSLGAQALPLEGGQRGILGTFPAGAQLPEPAQTAPCSGTGRKEPLSVCKHWPCPAATLPSSRPPRASPLFAGRRNLVKGPGAGVSKTVLPHPTGLIFQADRDPPARMTSGVRSEFLGQTPP